MDKEYVILKNIDKEIIHYSYGGMRYINMDSSRVDNPPILYECKSDCYGCTACYASCSKSGSAYHREIRFKELGDVDYTGAISMVPDEKGFFYPVVDLKVCVGCGICTSVCIFTQEDEK